VDASILEVKTEMEEMRKDKDAVIRKMVMSVED
jgi:hypothetical protein